VVGSLFINLVLEQMSGKTAPPSLPTAALQTAPFSKLLQLLDC
jgi:hypothetical protein